MMIPLRALFLYTVCSCISYSAVANIDQEFDELDAPLNMPLDSLTETKVVTATKTSLSLSDVPASVHIITSKEIERSSARSIADVLAPGLHVAKFSDYDWTVSARSKNQGENNTLLVMIDGRSAVNPMYSGVNWDTLPVSLDNIDRIEVVLGSVGTIWGGNAVNGVINIITEEWYSQPQVRALQKLTDNQRLWMGWGRAVITPSRLELDTQSNMAPLLMAPNTMLKSAGISYSYA